MEGVTRRMKNRLISKERKKYIHEKHKRKFMIILTQILILVIFLGTWEILARKGIIDSFLMSQPSRILKTFLHLTDNQLWMHIGVTVYETVVGFLIGTILGIVIAIILWWSNFISKVMEPYLVVLNSLPKVALRTNNYNLGWSWYISNYSYGCCNFINSLCFRKFKWIFKN
mgnify:CR=1 FL=1